MRDYLLFARKHLRFLSFGFALMFFSSFGQTFFLSLFSADIRAEFGLSHGDFGSIYSLATLVSGLTMLWLGRVIDRVPLRRFATGVCAGLIGAAFLLASVPGRLLLGVALFAMRLTGQGLMSHTAATTMTRYFDKGRGKAISIAMLGFPFGEALLPPIAVAADAALGWRNVWLAIGGLLLLTLVPLMLWLLRGHDERHDAFTRGIAADATPDAATAPRRTDADRTARQVLADPRFWAVVPLIVASPFLMTGFFFHQVHLVEGKGWTMGWYSVCFAAFAASSVAASVVSGPLVDRHGARRALPFFPLPMAAGLLVLASFGHPLTAPAYLVLAGLSAGSGGPIAGALWAEVYGPTHLGAIRSMVSALFVLSTAASPVLMGRWIDRGVTMETLATLGAAYTVGATALGAFAFRRGS